MRHDLRGWVVDLLAGGLAGGVLGAIVTVNLVIFSGAPRGYETTLVQLFDESPVLGVVVVVLLATGPVIGVIAARLLREKRESGP